MSEYDDLIAGANPYSRIGLEEVLGFQVFGNNDLSDDDNGNGDDSNSQSPSWWGYGDGGSSGPSNEQAAQRDKTVALDRYAAKTKVRAAQDKFDRFDIQRRANKDIAKSQLRTAALTANTDWFGQELKGQAGLNAMANAMGNGRWSSTSVNGLDSLVNLNRDLYTNEVYKNKRAQLNEIYNNLYNSEVVNKTNALNVLSELRENLRNAKVSAIANLDSIHADYGNAYFTGDGNDKRVRIKSDSGLSYYNDYAKWLDKKEAAYKDSIPQLQYLGLIRPDGPNRANSNPLVNRMQNTNTFNNAGTVAKSTNRNNSNRVAYLKASSTGYDYRDENPKMTQIETGR